MKSRKTKRFATSKVAVACTGGFILAAFFVAADEIFDIPAVVFNASPTPINWTEIGIETSFIFMVGSIVISVISWLDSKRKRAEESLHKVNRTLKTLSECNQILVQAADEPDLLHKICQAILEFGGYRLAWIGFVNQGDEKTVLPVAQAGFEQGYLDTINIAWDQTEQGGGLVGTTVRTGKACIVRNILTAPEFACWRSEATKYGYRSLIALPLFADSQTVGVLNVYSTESDAFDTKEVRLLTELANDLAYGIMALRTRAEHKQAEDALRVSEKRYRTTLDGMLEGCQIIDSEWRYVYLNDAAIRHSRRAREDLLGRTMMEAYPGIEDTEMFAQLRCCIQDRTSHRMENEFTYAGGNKGWFELSIEPVPEGALVLSQDITERKRVEVKLQTSRRFLEIAYRHHSTNSILQEFTKEIKDLTGCDAIGIRLLDESGNIPYVAYLGFSQKFYERESPLSIESDQCMCINVVRGTTDPRLPFYTEYGSFYMNGTTRFLATVSEEDKGKTRNVCNATGYESVALVPIRAGARIIGLVHLADRRENMVPLEMVKLLEQVSPSTGLAIQRVQSREALQQSEERIVRLNSVLKALRNVNQLIVREKDRTSLVQKACDLLVESPSYSLAWILLVDEDKDFVSFTAAGLDKRLYSSIFEQLKRGEYLECAREIFSNERSFAFCDDVERYHKGCPLASYHIGRAGFTSRLEYEGRVYGVMSVDVPRDAVLDAEEQGLFLELAGDISFALANIGNEERRKQAEEALRQSEEKCRAIFDAAVDGILLADLETKKFFSGNQAICQMLGYSQEEIEKLGVTDVHPQEDLSSVVAAFEAQAKKIIRLSPDIPMKRKDGSVFYADVNAATVTFAGRTYLLGMFRDATERRKAEEGVKASEERFRTIFEYAPDAYYMNDLEGRFINGNKAAERTSGYERSELIGKSFVDLNMLAPEEMPKAATLLARNATGQPTGPDEFNLIRKDGSQVTVEITSFPVEMEGKPLVLSIARDITERKKMTEQLMVTDRLASVGELASGIAHELNNPLTGVIGLSELLVEKDVPSNIREDLETIRSEAQRAARVVKNLLTFARKHPVSKEPVDVNEVVGKVLALRAYEQRVSNIQVNVQLAPDLPKVLCDYFQLQQVFLNIIINAEYFMIQTHGKGTLSIVTKKEGDNVQVSFADDGPGISRENLKHLFTPFFTTKEVGKGTGLGLSICHGVITAHNGKIYAESEPGKGATFVVELPLELQED
jgi:PAS domain S-box-containing protein